MQVFFSEFAVTTFPFLFKLDHLEDKFSKLGTKEKNSDNKNSLNSTPSSFLNFEERARMRHSALLPAS